VVVPLDGSPVAETVLPFIIEIAGPLDMDVVLLRVVQPIAPVVLEGATATSFDDAETRRIDAEEYLAALAAEVRAKGVRVETRVRRGEPAGEIVAGAREVRADLIAMSTHGRSGLGRLVFGSVAEAVLRRAGVPVFLLRATEADVERRAPQGISP
jgi:nucleotide-binding universal stress UspA family protein